MNSSILSVSRLLYAILTGGSLVLASLNPALIETVGAYTLQAGIAAAIAAVVPLGLDRSIARLRASGKLTFDIPTSLIRFRIFEIIILTAIAFAIAVAIGSLMLPLACLIFAVSRLTFGDLEALWIASPRPTGLIGVALITNGVVSAAGIVGGAHLGPEQMLLFSSLGNFCAAIVVAAFGRLQLGHFPLNTVRRETIGFGASAAVAVIYARIDIFILAILSVDLTAVAVYGIILRMFDALALIRGSISQLEIRSLAKSAMQDRLSQAMRVGQRLTSMSALAALLGLPLSTAILTIPAFSSWRDSESAIYIACLCVPLFMTHLSTSAVVLSDPRTHLLLAGSLISAALATVIKWALIASSGVSGAVAAIGICEFMSFVVFALLYRGEIPIRRLSFFIAPAVFLILITVALTTQGGR